MKPMKNLCLAAFAALSLMLAGCGSSDDSGAAPTAPSPTANPAATHEQATQQLQPFTPDPASKGK